MPQAEGSAVYIGCHLSVSEGFLAMGQTALAIHANTFQFFTRNPRGSRAKEIDPADAGALLSLMKEHSFAPVLGHAPYTLNPCSADPKVREFAALTMKDDLMRMEMLPGNLYNFHPGSHTGQGIEAGIAEIRDLLNSMLFPEQTTTVLLETMAGKGSEVGSRFEELRDIIGGVALPDKIGVCLDTCHVSDAGYDVVNRLDDVLEEFDRVIGIGRLKAIHLNDSMNPRGSHKDRHEKIGRGMIGEEAIGRIVNHPLIKDLPFYLETPNEIEGYAEEIRLIRSLYKEA